MKYVLLLLFPLFAHATPVEPVYQDLAKAEKDWAACWNVTDAAFYACIDRVAGNAERYYQGKMSYFEQLTAQRPDPEPKLKRFRKIQGNYVNYRNGQCDFEAVMKSNLANLQELQRARCRFRRAFASVIHMYDGLSLWNKGAAKEYDANAVPTDPSHKIEFPEMVERDTKAIASSAVSCYRKSEEVAARIVCAKEGVTAAKAYMETRLQGWYGILRAGDRGEQAYSTLLETQKHWEQYRRDFCNFIAEFHTGSAQEVSMGQLRGNHCVVLATFSRLRELFPKR